MFVSYRFILLFFPFISVQFLVARQIISEAAFFLASEASIESNDYGIKLRFGDREKRLGRVEESLCSCILVMSQIVKVKG